MADTVENLCMCLWDICVSSLEKWNGDLNLGKRLSKKQYKVGESDN
jgi:hypothetical protein